MNTPEGAFRWSVRLPPDLQPPAQVGGPVPVQQPQPNQHGQPALWLHEGITERNSLSHVLREWARELHRRGLAVHLGNYFPATAAAEHLDLAHQLPHHEPLGKQFVVSYTPYEPAWTAHGDALPILLDMVDTFRLGGLVKREQYDAHRLVLTLSEDSARYLRANSVEHVAVVPCGVDSQVFHPEVQPLPLSQAFDPAHPSFRAWGDPLGKKTFFLLSGFLQEKKAVCRAVEAFRLFHQAHPDCALLIKNTVSHWGKSVLQEIAEVVGDAAVAYTEQPLDDPEFPRLLAAVDVVLQPSHCEGFGLIPLQAMAVGKAVVVTAGTGFDEYATSANAALIPTRQVLNPLYPAFPWVDFTPEDGAAAYARALEMRSDPQAVQARQDTVARFTWARSVDLLLEALATVDPTPMRPATPAVTRGLTSVIVPLKVGPRGLADLERLAASFRAHETAPYEIIVLDDASAVPVTCDDARVRVFRVPYSEGVATARNRAALEARGEYLFFTDSDTALKGPVLDKLKERLGGDHRLVLHPKLVYPSGTIQSAGGVVVAGPGNSFAAYHRFEHQPADLPEAQVEADLQYGCTAALFFHRAVISDCGLLWEEYPVTYWEDVHFCYHLRQQGVTIRYFPAVEIQHFQGSFTSTMAPDTFMKNAQTFQRYFPAAALGV